MALHGSSFPLDDGSFVVTTVCPNAYSHRRLMQLIGTIVPDAGEPSPQPTSATVDNTATVSAYIAGFEPNEDGVIVKGGCATGSCDLE